MSRNWSAVEQVPGPGNRVAQRVPLQASLGADYAAAAWSTGASFVYRKGGWTTVSAAQRVLATSGRDLDLYALWKIAVQQQVRVTLGNVLARDDVGANQYVAATGSTMRTTSVPGHASIRILFEQKF